MEFERALVAFAHPDDAEFMCGGTVALWARGGTEITYVCATDGSAGWNGPDLTREQIAARREEEMRAVAAMLGVHDVRFLGYPDGLLHASFDLRRDLTREVRRARPDVVVTFDPSALWVGRDYIQHPDHRAVGEAMLAVVACDAPTRPQFPELLDEGLEPFKIRRVWLATDDDEGDVVVDVGETLDMKIKALQAHASQMENMEFDASARVREWSRQRAEREAFEYGERFRTFDIEV